MFAGLSNRRRRYILYYLQETRHTDVDALATQIAAWEQDRTLEHVADDHRDRIKHELTHSHLPKLTDYNLIEYDRRSGVVRFVDPPSVLEDALDMTAILEKPD